MSFCSSLSTSASFKQTSNVPLKKYNPPEGILEIYGGFLIDAVCAGCHWHLVDRVLEYQQCVGQLCTSF